MVILQPQKLRMADERETQLRLYLREAPLCDWIMLDAVFEHFLIFDWKFVGRMVVIFLQFIIYIFVYERNPSAPFNFVFFFIFVEAPSKTVCMGIDVFVGGIVTEIVPNIEVSDFFYGIRPGQPELIVPLVEFGLEGPLGIELKNIISFEWRTITDLGTESAWSMFVDILLDCAEKRAFLLCFNVDTRVVVDVVDTFESLLDGQLVLFMHKFPQLQLLFTFCLENVFQVFLFLLQR